MKIAMLILGIIGSLAALGGSLVTMIGGMAGTAAGAVAEKSDVAMGGAMIFWSGALTVALGLFALITSVVGGVSKKKNTVMTFGIATLVAGALNVYLFNWTSGILLGFAGLLGMIGSKDSEASEKSFTKSPMFYVVVFILLVFLAIAAAFRNADKISEAGSKPPVSKGVESVQSPENSHAQAQKKMSVEDALDLVEKQNKSKESITALAASIYYECYDQMIKDASAKGKPHDDDVYNATHTCNEKKNFILDCMASLNDAYACVENSHEN